jgi:hypothetical protein
MAVLEVPEEQIAVMFWRDFDMPSQALARSFL